MGNAVRVGPTAEDPSLYSSFKGFSKQKSSSQKRFHANTNDCIRLISLTELIKHCEFPRYPLDEHRTELLTRHDLLSSFVVFISHVWLRGSPSMPGYDGNAHPDTDDHEKYKLTVEALIKIHRIYAPGFDSIYIWFDYGCIDQNGNPSKSCSILSDVIYFSDCLLTPLVDDTADKWEYNTSSSCFNALNDYLAPSFRHGSQAYLNRSWCRLEIFFASFLPVKNTSWRGEVSTDMKTFQLNGQRPHFLFGSKESYDSSDPVLMEPFTKDMLELYDPTRGQLTHSSDEEVIRSLVENELMMLLKKPRPCYVGERNKLLQKHGKGYTVHENGDIYEGEYSLSKRHGYGKMMWADGDVYEGSWQDNRIEGQGKMVYADGEVYDGNWKNELRHGHGTLWSNDGSIYDGEFTNGSITGCGSFTYPDNSHYEGDMEDGIREGYGVMIYNNLDVYRGQFSKGNMHGEGLYRDSRGNEYDGDWVNNEKHGTGTYKYANGNVYQGEWQHNKKHGEGVLTGPNGLKYSGYWKKGVWKG